MSAEEAILKAINERTKEVRLEEREACAKEAREFYTDYATEEQREAAKEIANGIMAGREFI